MNKRKAGLVTAGVVTALVAASPLAWAVGPSQVAPEDCSFSADGTDAAQSSVITQDNPANAVAQAPVTGDNTGIYGQCSTFNNTNGEGNLQDNVVIPPLGLPPIELPTLPTDAPVNQ